MLKVSVSAQLADEVAAIAGRMKRSRSWVARQALIEWVARAQFYQRMTLEGLEDIDAGRVIEHETVLAWADNLEMQRP